MPFILDEKSVIRNPLFDVVGSQMQAYSRECESASPRIAKGSLKAHITPLNIINLLTQKITKIVVLALVALQITHAVPNFSELMCCMAEGRLIKVAILHRHGARTSAGIQNGKIRYDAPFGILTDFGESQCKALGSYVRSHYADELGIGSRYASARIRSRSTAVPRVIKSGVKFLEGLFPDAVGSTQNGEDIALSVSKHDASSTEVSPMVSTFTFPNDDRENLMLSPWNGAPAFVFQDRHTRMIKMMTNITRQTFTYEEVEYARAVMGLAEGSCDSTPYFCIELLQDIIMANLSMPERALMHKGVGELQFVRDGPHDERLIRMIPRLQHLQAVFVNTMLGYSFPSQRKVRRKSSPWARMGESRGIVCEYQSSLSRQGKRAAKRLLQRDVRMGFIKSVGSLGFPLMRDIFTFFENSSDKAPLMHYSAHDYTLSAIYGALGAVDFESFDDGCTVPRFGDAVIFELHLMNNTSQSYETRVYRARPTEVMVHHAAPITISVEPLGISCGVWLATSAGGRWRFVDSPGGNCSLEGLRASVTARGPTSPDGYCYASEYDLSVCSSAETGKTLTLSNRSKNKCQRFLNDCLCSSTALAKMSPAVVATECEKRVPAKNISLWVSHIDPFYVSAIVVALLLIAAVAFIRANGRRSEYTPIASKM